MNIVIYIYIFIDQVMYVIIYTVLGLFILRYYHDDFMIEIVSALVPRVLGCWFESWSGLTPVSCFILPSRITWLILSISVCTNRVIDSGAGVGRDGVGETGHCHIMYSASLLYHIASSRAQPLMLCTSPTIRPTHTHTHTHIHYAHTHAHTHTVSSITHISTYFWFSSSIHR